MSGFLLDVNVLIARSDARHEFFERTRRWMATVGDTPLFLCPIVENGFARIYGHPSYPGGPGSPAAALSDLRRIRALPTIRFIPDDLSIGDASVFSLTDDVGSKGITDLYLLGLAAHHGIAFATLDEAVRTDTVKDGGAALFVVPW